MKVKHIKRKVNFAYIHKLTAGVSLLALAVVIAAGVMGGASTVAITYRSAAVIIVIGVVARLVERILLSYEEMHSGKT